MILKSWNRPLIAVKSANSIKKLGHALGSLIFEIILLQYVPKCWQKVCCVIFSIARWQPLLQNVTKTIVSCFSSALWVVPLQFHPAIHIHNHYIVNPQSKNHVPDKYSVSIMIVYLESGLAKSHHHLVLSSPQTNHYIHSRHVQIVLSDLLLFLLIAYHFLLSRGTRSSMNIDLDLTPDILLHSSSRNGSPDWHKHLI